ncbi:MAG: hypothetical protein J6X30_02700 [Clostridia bacterium]|nr:hypothetical protein [Clostridia bacterium]
MIEKDTVKLLRECDAGIRMGIDSLQDALGYVRSEELKRAINECKREHDALKTQCDKRLQECGDEGKKPAALIQIMSEMKTNMRMMADRSDSTLADLMTDGCNMGIKSLNRYLNQYKAADENSKDIAKRLIHLEEQLTRRMRPYL